MTQYNSHVVAWLAWCNDRDFYFDRLCVYLRRRKYEPCEHVIAWSLDINRSFL
jgi:hypothetical protein